MSTTIHYPILQQKISATPAAHDGCSHGVSQHISQTVGEATRASHLTLESHFTLGFANGVRISISQASPQHSLLNIKGKLSESKIVSI